MFLFISGLFIGVTFGLVIMSIMAVASKSDQVIKSMK